MTAAYQEKLHLFSRDIRLFFVTAALTGFAWDGMWAVLFNLYVVRLGYGTEMVGLLNAAGALLFAALALPAGALGTRWTNRRMLILGTSLMALASALLPLSELAVSVVGPVWLFGVILLAHVGLALYLVNGLPFMMDATGPEERSHVFSVHIAISPVSAFAGSLMGGILPGLFASTLGVSPSEPAAFRYPFLLAAGVLCPGILALSRTQTRGDSRAKADGAGTGRAPYGLILLVALVMALRFGGRGAVVTFFNVYLDDALGTSTALIGALYAASQVLAVPAALAAPVVVARWGSVRTITWGSLAMAICLLPLVLIPRWGAAGAGFVSSTAFFYLTTGPVRLFSQELVAPRWRSTMAAAFMLGAGLGFAITAWTGGRVIPVAGYQPLFLAGTVLIAVSALVYWTVFRVPRGEPGRAADRRSAEPP